MSILRRENWLGQQRVDVPHLKLVESAVAGDFDALAGRVLAGAQPLIVRGFNVITTGAVGAPATQLQVAVANAIAINVNATQSGSVLWVSPTRAPETLANNVRVSGSFTPAATNFIGLDFSRAPDATTNDVVAFFSASSLVEITEEVPLGITLDYVFVVTTTPFALQPNVCPLAVVTTDASNFVLTLADARNLNYRLGTGGDNPQAQATYAWPGGRLENTTGDVFSGGDKAISSQRDWQQAVMTRVWELGGGEAWYRPTNTLNLKMIRRPGFIFGSTGDAFEVVGGNLHWQGISFLFPNAQTPGLYYNVVADQTTNQAGLTDLKAGECLYVDLNYTTNGATVTAVKTTMQTLSQSVLPGNRVVMAWRSVDATGFYTRDATVAVGTVFTFAPATTSTLGAVELTVAAANPASPLVIPVDANNTLNVGTGTGAIIGDNPAINAVGHGTGSGVVGTGGTSNGAGGFFVGGGSYGVGVVARARTGLPIPTPTYSYGLFAAGGTHGGFEGVAGVYTIGGQAGVSGVGGDGLVGLPGAGVATYSGRGVYAVGAGASAAAPTATTDGAALQATALDAKPAIAVDSGKISLSYTDTGAGDATANNSITGRSAILTGHDTVTITNSLVTSTSVVLCQVESAGATWGGVLSCIPTNGSFSVHSVTAAGALTNVSVTNLIFRWVVVN